MSWSNKMLTRISFNKFTWMTAILFVTIVTSSITQAAPGQLAQSPLFIANKVQPNIFFALDDSGSMDWEDTLNDGTPAPGDAVLGGFSVQPPVNDGTWIAGAEFLFRRLTCSGYNVMAYDPNVLYTPWKGEDDDGDDYTDRTLATALDNPYDDGVIVNVSNHVYFPWNDMDGDGAYDGPTDPDFITAITLGADPSDECGDVSAVANGVAVNSLPLTGTTAAPNSQQNYANWYSYYRKREYVAKRAISELISDSNERMGLATLHNNNNVGTEIEDMTNNSDKDDLLDELGQVNSTGGTPLRRLLENVGEYFDQAGNNNDHSPLGFNDPSPILTSANGGECQQNFAVLFSDGFWNGGDPGVGNTDTDGAGAWDGGSHADTFNNTLADVAMHFYETDLSGLDNNVPKLTGIDENDAQHLVTYTVAFGVNGTISSATAGTDASGNPVDRTTPFAWPQPVADDPTTVDDMRHAAWNGRGEFLSARDPATLISALSAAINSISDRQGSAAAVTFNTSSLQSGSRVYLSEFNTSGWEGDMLAYDLNATTGALNSTPAWSAQTELDARNLTTSPRTIFTYDDNDGVLFTWANINNAMKDDFRTNPDNSTSSDAVAQSRMAFIAGDRSNEGAGNNFRTRTSRLGDIVHSAPKFVGSPEQNYPDADPFGSSAKRYSTFQSNSTYVNRTKVIYALSNDGMLHGFKNSGGDEILSYIPSFLSSTNAAGGLHYLTDRDYAHTYYADHTASIDDVFIRTTPSGTKDWRTVLVSGVRGGASGIFALDITNPSNFTINAADAAKTVLWEFDNTDDSDLGFSFSEPSVVMLNNNEWGVIFGNGYNNTGTGEAAVYLLLLEGGLDGDGTGVNGAWANGTNYFKLTTGSGTTSNLNGMSTLTPVDLDNNGTMDRLYGGDIKGNLWVFDISDTDPMNWGSAYTDNSSNPIPLFNSPNNQQITVQPDVIRLPDIPTTPQNSPNVMVYFGTGQYIATNDNSTTDQQAFYGVWDAGTGNLTTSDLVEQTLDTDSVATNARYVSSNNTVLYSGSPVQGTNKFGWYMDLLASGERVIVDPVVRGQLVFFATMVPDSSTCSTGGGSGFLMAVTLENGGNPLNGSFDVNADGVIDANDSLGLYYSAGIAFNGAGIPAGLSFLGNNRLYVPDTGGGGGAANVQISQVVAQNPDANGRLSWQEMVYE